MTLSACSGEVLQEGTRTQMGGNGTGRGQESLSFDLVTRVTTSDSLRPLPAPADVCAGSAAPGNQPIPFLRLCNALSEGMKKFLLCSQSLTSCNESLSAACWRFSRQISS